MTSNGPVRLVVFDCDGTLVDSQHMIVAAMQAAFRACGRDEPEPARVRGIVGLSLLEAMARLAPDAETGSHHDLVDAYRSAFATLRGRPEHQDALYPGAVEALDDLDRAGFLLGVATGKSLRGLRATIERHALDGRFATLQTADAAPSKPHPGMLERAMAEVGAEATRTVVVGDTTFDMEMAANAGVEAIGVSWGYHPSAALRQSGAREIIDDFAALAPIVRTIVTEAGGTE